MFVLNCQDENGGMQHSSNLLGHGALIFCLNRILFNILWNQHCVEHHLGKTILCENEFISETAKN